MLGELLLMIENYLNDYYLLLLNINNFDPMMKNNEHWNYYLMFDEHQMLMDKLF
jgi:hypothetical protein